MVSDTAESKDEFVRPKKPRIKKKRSRTDSETTTVSEKSEISTVPKKPIRKNSIKKKRKSAYNRNEEARLESLVFGDPSDVIKNLLGDSDEKIEAVPDPEPERKVKAKFTKQTSDSSDSDDHENDSIVLMKSDDESVITVDSRVSIKAAAWKDDDDENLSVNEALKLQHRKLPVERPEKTYNQLVENKYAQIVGTPKWAELNREKEEDSDDSDSDILKHSNHLVPSKSTSLPKGTIEIKALSQINKQTHIEGPFINTVRFHETSTVALVAGSAGILSLFEVDGRENNKLQSVQFQNFPIYTARFLKEGTQILVGSMHHAHCFSYDLMTEKTLRIPLPHGITNMKKFEISPDGKIIAVCGRLGEIHLLSSATKEIIGTMKMNKKCRSLAFTPDSQKLITHGESSEMYVWDVNTRTCCNRAYDDGCLAACAVAISPNGQFLATGSKQGAVNLYETKSVIAETAPVPVKTVLNLVTSITQLRFNPSTEILAFASDCKPNAFKMLHIPSFHVFSNFPSFNTKMCSPLDIDFSPASGYLSVSNNMGSAYLYRLKHYGNY